MKTILYGKDAREHLLSGVEIIAGAVKTTLGPSGRNVLIRNIGENRPFSTKDGVTVAGQISHEDPVLMTAIESIQDIANNSDYKAGDGTTTATIIGEAIFKSGIDFPDHLNLLDIKKGIDKAVKIVVQALKDHAIDVKENKKLLRQVALISSNYDEKIADLVFKSFEVAGKQGVVNIKRTDEPESYVSVVEGMNIPMGYKAKIYANTEKETCEFKDAYVYMTEKHIMNISKNFDALLNKVAEENAPLLIICGGMDPAISEMLIDNKVRAHFKVCVCKAPGFGNNQKEYLEDLGVVLGKRPFLENDDFQFDDIKTKDIFDYIPRSEEVVIGLHRSSIKGPVGISEEEAEAIEKNIQSRADSLRAEVENTHTQYEKSELQARISRLSDGIAFINIAGRSDTEFIERQARIQDALYAIKSAYEEGIVPGGGAALLSISAKELNMEYSNESENYGKEILKKAIRKPFFQIIENVGQEHKLSFWNAIKSLFEKKYNEHTLLSPANIKFCEENFLAGFNAKEKETCLDMIQEGIIDPAKVTRVALENASSIAGMLLTTECVVVDPKVYDEPKMYQ